VSAAGRYVDGSDACILVAPSSFKGTLSAAGASACLSDGLRQGGWGGALVQRPLADGGEGTLEALCSVGATRETVEVRGPMGAPVTAAWAHLGRTAYVEIAEAVGVGRLAETTSVTALESSTYGVGQLVAAALDHGFREVVITTGGSVTSDGGAGMAQALGARLLTESGEEVMSQGNRCLPLVHRVDTTSLHPQLRLASVTVACDVRSPLLGPLGAARVYGPQKGATPDDVAHLEAGLRSWARAVGRSQLPAHLPATAPGAGASGGLTFGIGALIAAQVVGGAELMMDLLGIDGVLDSTDLVVVGEGSLDEQSRRGKATLAVACRASRQEIPVVAVAGQVRLPQSVLSGHGVVEAWSLSRLAGDHADAERDVRLLLTRAGLEVARWWAGSGKTKPGVDDHPSRQR
jgi:glycerate 2-kinase